MATATTHPLMLLHQACTATEARGNQVIADALDLAKACAIATVQIRALGEQFAAAGGNTELQALFTEELTACVRLAATLPPAIVDCQADLAEFDGMLEEAITRCQMAEDSREADLVANLASFASLAGASPPFTCYTSLQTYCKTHALALQKLRIQRISFGERLRVVLGVNGEKIKPLITSTALLRRAAQSSPAWTAAEETANAAASEAASQRAAARTARLETQRATQPVEQASLLGRLASGLSAWWGGGASTAGATGDPVTNLVPGVEALDLETSSTRLVLKICLSLRHFPLDIATLRSICQIWRAARQNEEDQRYLALQATIRFATTPHDEGTPVPIKATTDAQMAVARECLKAALESTQGIDRSTLEGLVFALRHVAVRQILLDTHAGADTIALVLAALREKGTTNEEDFNPFKASVAHLMGGKTNYSPEADFKTIVDGAQERTRASDFSNSLRLLEHFGVIESFTHRANQPAPLTSA